MFEIYPKGKPSDDSVLLNLDGQVNNDKEAKSLCYSRTDCVGFRSYIDSQTTKYQFYSSIPSTQYSTDDSVLYIKRSNNNLTFIMGTLFIILLVVLYWMTSKSS